MTIKQNQPIIKLKEYRIKAGLSQNALAKISGVSQSHISEIESGVKRVGLEITKKLADALGVSIEDLINDDPDQENDLDDMDISGEE
jgi:transcriptional regulator with XRE-family HTH domain